MYPELKHATINDLPEIQNLFVETIFEICYPDYNKEQLHVWAPAIQNKQNRIEKIEKQFFIIALTKSKIVVFGSLENNDYIDLLYIHKDFQKQGIASIIFNCPEEKALKAGVRALQSDVSKTARHFFERLGFYVVSEQSKIISSIEINNYKMEKQLLQNL